MYLHLDVCLCVFQGAGGTNITIKVLCGMMLDSSLGDPYDRYAALVRLMQEMFSESCTDVQYKNYVQDMSNTSWSGPAAEGGVCFLFTYSLAVLFSSCVEKCVSGCLILISTHLCFMFSSLHLWSVHELLNVILLSGCYEEISEKNKRI